MGENEKMEEVVYYHKGVIQVGVFVRWIIIFVTILLGIGTCGFIAIVPFAILSFFIKTQLWMFFIFWIPLSLFTIYKILMSEGKSKPSYKIYQDRIEFFNENYPLEKDIIDLEEIDQVRYEDDFGKSYSSSVASQSWIYCYFKNGYKSRSIRIQKDRIKLDIKRDQERENKVIQILQFFQKQKKQVYISTKSEKIKTALNLKNWTDPGIHPSIKI